MTRIKIMIKDIARNIFVANAKRKIRRWQTNKSLAAIPLLNAIKDVLNGNITLEEKKMDRKN